MIESIFWRNSDKIPRNAQSFGETLAGGGKKERAQDGFSASRARLRVWNMDFEEMIWRNAAGKPLWQGFFGHQGVKEIYQPLYQKLVETLAEAVGFEPTCPLGQPHFELSLIFGTWRKMKEDKLRYFNIKGIIRIPKISLVEYLTRSKCRALNEQAYRHILQQAEMLAEEEASSLPE